MAKIHEYRANSHDEELADLRYKTDQIETEKEAKKAARVARHAAKELAHKRAFQEKLVAPFLLLVTVGVCVLLFLFF